ATAGYLALLFSQAALRLGGSAWQILAAARDGFQQRGDDQADRGGAADQDRRGDRQGSLRADGAIPPPFPRGLRARIRERVLPGLAAAVAARVGPRTEAELRQAYRQTLVILFRTLFLGYAEASGLLPGSDHAAYGPFSVRGLGRDLADPR